MVLYQDAPSGVQLIRVNANQLVFNWNSVDSTCLPNDYNITFDCGNCSITTNMTVAVCSDLLIPSTCDFSIQYIVCGQVGSASDPVIVTLKGMCMYSLQYSCNVFTVPDKPNVTIIPIYSADNMTLIRFNASIEQEVSEFTTA